MPSKTVSTYPVSLAWLEQLCIIYMCIIFKLSPCLMSGGLSSQTLEKLCEQCLAVLAIVLGIAIPKVPCI